MSDPQDDCVTRHLHEQAMEFARELERRMSRPIPSAPAGDDTMAEQPDYAALADRVGQWSNITPNNRADLLTALRQAAQEREALETAINSEAFDVLMYAYRCAPVRNPEGVSAAFVAVQDFLRAALLKGGQS